MEKTGDGKISLWNRVSWPLKTALIAAAVFLAGGILWLTLWPRPTWYVEERFVSDWEFVLRRNDPPFTRIRAYTPEKGPPRRGTGWIITGGLGDGVEDSGGASEKTWGAVRIIRFPDGTLSGDSPDSALADAGEDAVILALDPWLVFYKHSQQGLSRNRAEAAGEGSLLLPSGEDEALWAWASQLLQERPGIFTADEGLWKQTLDDLPGDSRFRVDTVDLLLQHGQSWLYAPLSRMRELSSFDMGLLTAEAFPCRPEWNEYGLQAEILQAIPMTGKRQTKKLAAAKAWLLQPEIQTAIADQLKWIPAHPQGEAYNPISRDAQMAWFSSSFLWQRGR